MFFERSFATTHDAGYQASVPEYRSQQVGIRAKRSPTLLRIKAASELDS
jgi:hypothetical protein